MRSSQEDVCMHVCIFRYREEIVSIMYWYKVCEERGEECVGYPYPSHAAR
jgi:hypothetical protein